MPLIPNAEVALECDRLADVCLQSCRPCAGFCVRQFEYGTPARISPAGLARGWRLGVGQIQAAFKSTNVQLAVIATTLGRVGSLQGVPFLRTDTTESLTVVVIGIDEGLVEFE